MIGGERSGIYRGHDRSGLFSLLGRRQQEEEILVASCIINSIVGQSQQSQWGVSLFVICLFCI